MSQRTESMTGSIASGHLYTAQEARRRLGLGEWAWRQFRRAGLNVIRTGNSVFVLGDDLIAFLKTRSTVAQTTGADAQRAA